MRVLLSALLVILPLQAQALSCLAPSVARSFQQYDAAEESYLIVQGRLTFDEKQLPKNSFGNQQPPQMTFVEAHLTGKSMTRAGFRLPFEHDVVLEVACFGPWCGGAKDGGEVMAFVRVEAGSYALDINPCGGAVFPEPRHKMLEQALQCFRGGTCEETVP